MTIVGGRRLRYIHDSIEAHVLDIITQLHYLDPGRRHAPVQILPKPKKWNDPIDYNTITVDVADMVDIEAEMGSNLTDDQHTVYIDFYGENDSISRELAGDLTAALRGKMPSIGRTRMKLDIFDLAAPTQPPIFYVTVENVVTDKAHNFPEPWRAHWISVRFDATDTYGDEYDSALLVSPTTLPGPDTLTST